MLYFLFLIPVFISSIFLFSALAFQSDDIFYNTLLFHLPPLILVLMPIAWLVLKYGMKREDLPQHFWLYLCFLAPFAVMYPWVVSNGSALGGLGGILYFMEWLTKNPNFGTINLEVLTGIVCVISIAFFPAIFAYKALEDKPNVSILMLLFIGNLIMFVPVFIRLDLMLWVTGLNSDNIPADSTIHGLGVVYGPLLHTVPLVIMISYILYITFRKPSHSYYP